MQPRTNVILQLAIEEGVNRGWNLAHKHVEEPTEEAIKQRIEEAVMAAIYEYFTFNQDEF